MKAVPKKKLWSCHYRCSDQRGCMIFLALIIPSVVLLMSWIDGTGLKNLPGWITVWGVGVIIAVLLFVFVSMRRAEYNYFEALAQAAADPEREDVMEIVAEIEENRGARIKNFIMRDPEKLFLLGKILACSAQNSAIGKKMVSIALEFGPELKEFENFSWKEAAQRYVALNKKG